MMNDGSQMRGGGTPSRSRSGMNILAQQLGSSPTSGGARRYPDSMLDLKNRSGQVAESGGRKRKADSELYAEKARNILARKRAKLAEVKNRYTDAVAEYTFIHFKGEVNDYANWKRRPMLPQVVNYLKTFRLEPNEDLVIQPPPSVQQQPEMRISGGVPVAVSTTLPAAVARLTQQGGTPLDPEHSSDKKAIGSPRKISVSSLSPRQNSRQQSVSSFCDKSLASSDQIAEKAKQEAFVLQRISELQRDGLWAEKRLPKVSEPQRVKAHWDYLLEEMVWLAADFAQERKWKKAAAKKCARMVQKHFQEKEMAAQKQAKAAELQLKRIASFMAKEVKTFWADIEKLVEFKQKTKLEEKRKKALDQHLSFLVDQTEKFSSLVAESMNKSSNSNAATPTLQSAASSRPSTPLQAGESDGEFEPNQSSDDDEETIAKAEQEEVVDHSKEVDMLKQESELPLEDFLKSLPKDYLANRHKKLSSESEEEDESTEGLDDEYKTPDEESSDDETTITEQEKAEGGQDHTAEIENLEKDNILSLDELMAKYGAPSCDSEQVSDEEADEEDVENENEEEDKDDGLTGDSSSSETEEQCIGLKSLLDQSSPQKEVSSNASNEQADKEINDAAALAESIQPKGNTLSSTSVVTKIPFLLKHSLREYQHIGLDWLVTMFDRKLNGILADEMGLGKTIQTIALLAHLACEKGIWGPHLIVVPTSVMLNWEMEFKKWCPAFKILVYYGSQKERRLKRTGWTKNNAFHICITSYKLVIQDHQSFRRKKWKYLILDEAQNIKNFKSQRWQLLLNFQTHRRLLLTGTPLQNNLMELWSLMHFLMPEMFQSHSEFKEWFSKPVTGMIEGLSEYNDQIIKRLHKVLRPFLLRRLKSEVEKQLPKKYEHVVMCRLSNRQRYLYDDFMSRAKTKETLASGNMLSVINVLMQLRKVCNHPNLFEPRPIVSPFQMDRLELNTASLVWTPLDYDPLKHIDLQSLNFHLLTNENRMNAFSAHRCKKYCYPRKLIEEIDSAPPSPPPCPPGKLKIIQRRDLMKAKSIQSLPVADNPSLNSLVNHKTSALVNAGSKVNCNSSSPLVRQLMSQTSPGVPTPVTFKVAGTNAQLQLIQHQGQIKVMGGSELKLKVVAKSGAGGAVMSSLSGSLTKLASSVNQQNQMKPILRIHSSESAQCDGMATATSSLPGLRSSANSSFNSNSSSSISTRRKRSCNMNDSCAEEKPNSCFAISEMVEAMHQERCDKLRCIARINDIRCNGFPLYGSDLVDILKCVMDQPNPSSRTQTQRHWLNLGYVNALNAWRLRHSNKYFWSISNSLDSLIRSLDDRATDLRSIFTRYLVFVPAVCAPVPRFHVSHPAPSKHLSLQHLQKVLELELLPKCDILHPIVSALLTQFPDPRLIQYDCGKLQTLDQLLRRLKSGNHRVLIFTQMTRMLDVLEAFLTYHGHIYLRLDGTTKVDQRMALMERFNGDKRIFCFILSTRSGGVGVNLTGADTVIFFDSDWNPTMDAQAQDRCHRIGQTRDVHIYRLISEKTVEENILKKANRKRLLGDIAIEGGNFTTVYFKSSTIQDLFTVDANENDAMKRMTDEYEKKPSIQPSPEEISTQPEEKIGTGAMGVLENALAAAEDETDVAAAKTAKAEAAADLAEFDESIPIVDQEPTEEVSKAEQEVNNLVQQLTPVEQWAMKFMESMDMETYAEQFAQAEAEIEQQKREWEQKRLIMNEDDNSEEEVDEMLTYSSRDSRNQVTKVNMVKTNGLSKLRKRRQADHLSPKSDTPTRVSSRLAIASSTPLQLSNGDNKSLPPNKVMTNNKLADSTPKFKSDKLLKASSNFSKQNSKSLSKTSASANVKSSKTAGQEVKRRRISSLSVQSNTINKYFTPLNTSYKIPKKMEEIDLELRDEKDDIELVTASMSDSVVHNSIVPYSNPNLVIRTRRASATTCRESVDSVEQSSVRNKRLSLSGTDVSGEP